MIEQAHHSPLLSHIALDEFDFDQQSDWHGVEHTRNVVNNVRAIGTQDGLEEQLIRIVECAAFIHDMARTHDRECSQHGYWAVDRKLPERSEKFFTYGLSEKDLDALKFAVVYHCRHDAPQDSPFMGHLLLLKKADAMDRKRFPWNDQPPLDPYRD